MKSLSTSPNKKRLLLIFILLVFAIFIGAISNYHIFKSSEEVFIPGESVGVPLVMENDLPIVEVIISKKGPFLFLVDTGSSVAKIDTDLMKQIAFEDGNTTIGHRSIDGQRTIKKLYATDINIGKALIRDVVFTEDTLPFFGESYQGILGFESFKNCCLNLNFINRSLTISKKVSDAGKYPVQIKYKLKHYIPHCSLNVGNEVTDAVIDTGNAGALVLPRRIVNQLNKGPVYENAIPLGRNYFNYKLNSRIDSDANIENSLQIREPVVEWFNSDTFSISSIGMQIWKNFSLEFDLKNKILYCKPDKNWPVRIKGLPAITEISLEAREDGHYIRYITKDSQAKKLGLIVGDKVTAIDGRPLTQERIKDFTANWWKSDRLKVTVQRGNKNFDVELPKIKDLPGPRDNLTNSDERGS